MMQAGLSPSFPLLGLCLCSEVGRRLKWSLISAHPLRNCLFVSRSVGPGCQRQGPAEYGHHVLSSDHLTHRFSEQDGAPGSF